MNIRKRTRAAPPGPQAQEPAVRALGQDDNEGPHAPEIVDPDSGLNLARLKLVLSLVAQGKKHKEIAAHIGRDPRTVRRMLKQAKELGLAVSEHLVPEDAVAQVMQDFAGLRADLIDMKREAEAGGNFKHRLWCARELLRLEVGYVATLDRIGFFDGYRVRPTDLPDPGADGARRLIEAARSLVSGPLLEGEATEVQND